VNQKQVCGSRCLIYDPQMPIRYHTGRFPPTSLDWRRLIPLIGSANAAVARYDGLLQGIPNPRVLLSPLTTQEAVLSSRIEGTQATMGEVLEFEAGAEESSPAKTQDIHEVLNYRGAIREAERLMKDLPLSQRVVKAAHKVLMQNVRGNNKSPGEYRRVPNWIGPIGCTEETARFVPINAADLPDAMGRWEKYLHESGHDKLIQLAVAHAEFESLHPFLDGNGRLGRMLVPLFLWQAGVIHMPTFYLSAYLEQRRDEYYDKLLAVSRDDDWTGWCEFFLAAIQAQANENMDKVRKILALYDELKLKVVEWSHSQYAVIALDWMFERPIFSSPDFVNSVAIPEPTAKRVLRVFREKGMLTAIREGRGRRSSILSFPKLLNAAEGYEAFEERPGTDSPQV
jgi:Fic family protein